MVIMLVIQTWDHQSSDNPLSYGESTVIISVILTSVVIAGVVAPKRILQLEHQIIGTGAV